ncbi:maestro heat-like repeat-containing protein family member 6 isoform X2 [Anas acuta]|uniref:maestro heat-like repeat-containing protein family member 6 isoform X2 n=1 Tax=Anas acuta TaxID=28680 RepID=UPI0035C93795
MAARGCGQPEGRRSRQRKGAAWCHAQGTEGPCFLLQAQLPQDEHLDRHLGACPPHPALSCQGSQELRGDGHAAGSAHLSRLWSFQMMHPTEHVLSNLRDPKKLLTLLSLNSLPILWLVLRALVMLSETSQMVTDVQVLLPEVMETLQYENTHINMKALTIFKNVIRHLEKKEASPIALTLAGRLLPLFNDVSSEVRECSMLLFKDLMESVLWWKKGEMKKTVHRAIIPLLFRMSDNTESVAKVSAVILLACAKFLKWKQLEQLAQTEDIWKIGEYLLKQKRSRVEGYLQQSLPYLWDDQTSLRQMAVKFVVLRMQCDTHPSIRILAAGTIEILQRQVQQQPASRWARLKALRCWP